jgi:hypothetical protein
MQAEYQPKKGRETFLVYLPFFNTILLSGFHLAGKAPCGSPVPK